VGDNFEGNGDGGNDVIKSGKGNDINFGDNLIGSGAGGNDKINAAQGDDELTGGGGADTLQT
jgi:Ca2+-binding RTX toxin-like protein